MLLIYIFIVENVMRIKFIETNGHTAPASYSNNETTTAEYISCLSLYCIQSCVAEYCNYNAQSVKKPINKHYALMQHHSNWQSRIPVQ